MKAMTIRRCRAWQIQQRLVVTKASNRAAVHGSKLPIPDIIDKEEVEKEIRKCKEEKEKRLKELEVAVDSTLQPWKNNVISPST